MWRRNKVKKPLFIVNLQSHENNSINKWRQVEHLLDLKDINYDVKYTHKRKTAVDLVRRDKKHKTIIVVGGDGGVNSLVEGAMKNDLEKILGTIPAGTANDIARAFDIYSTPEKFYLALQNENNKKTDVGEVNGKYFLAHASLGFDTLALNERNKRRFLKGKLAYFAAVFRTLFKYTSNKMKIKFSDLEMDKQVFMMVVSNINYYADGMKIAPFAKTNDGLLDLCLIEGKSNFESLFLNLPSVYNGKHLNNPQIHYNQLKKLEISSAEPVFLQADGDIVSKGNYFKFGLADRKLNFLC